MKIENIQALIQSYPKTPEKDNDAEAIAVPFRSTLDQEAYLKAKKRIQFGDEDSHRGQVSVNRAPETDTRNDGIAVPFRSTLDPEAYLKAKQRIDFGDEDSRKKQVLIQQLYKRLNLTI
jgi:hypothetical protein